MWIEPDHREHHHRSRERARLGIKIAVLLGGLSCCGQHATLQAEQYRSKLLLQPGQSLGEASELSIEQMEAELDSMQDSYSRASAGMKLAQHYVQQKQYDKAIRFYQQALAEEGLSPLVNQRLYKEWASVYLIMKDGQNALKVLKQWMSLDKTEDQDVALMFAQASYLSGDYLLTARALDRTMQLAPRISLDFHRPVLALSFSIGDFSRAQTLLKAFIELQPDEPENWFRLASVYLKQEKTSEALAILTLANSKGVVFDEQNLLLYSSLLATEKNPFKAALVLQQGLENGLVNANGKHYRLLFEYWYQAQETDRAMAALKLAADVSGDTELYLFYAQLLMQQERWQEMNQVVKQACQSRIAPSLAGKANLLLGISELKSGRTRQAREAFNRATLIGGENAKAGEWLRYMANAAGEEVSEAYVAPGAKGPCLASSD